jgi:hypothetical protein
MDFEVKESRMGAFFLAAIGIVFFLCVALVAIVGAVLFFGTTAVTFVEAFAGEPAKPSPEANRQG